jgi:hypothetical protein
MVVDAKGRAYVGNFGFDLNGTIAARGPEAMMADHALGKLARVDPDGTISVAAEDMDFANGTVITPDGKTLIIGESLGGRLTAFDIFAAAGLRNPDISILSEQFLAEVRGMQHENLAVELLRKLLNDEVKARSRHNLMQSRSFAEMLEKSIRRYQSRAIEAAQVIEELIELARDMREAGRRGEALDLSSDELAFYDALEVNDSAVKVLGDGELSVRLAVEA